MARQMIWRWAGTWCWCMAALVTGVTAAEPGSGGPPAPLAPPGLAFAPAGDGYAFDTGLLRGVLRADGRSMGLLPAVDSATGGELAASLGLFSHYRLLDAETRYGTAGWDWASRAELRPDGAVEVRWSADAEHPFNMSAVYRWSAPGTLDLVTTVTAQRALRRFEVFLASYFAGFPAAYAYVGPCPQTQSRAAFLDARQANGNWQSFPRDEEAAGILRDGRWTRPPHPVDWTIMPRLGAPLAIRRDPERGLAAVLMAPPSDCFAVSMPYGAEGHRSVYLSLFGRDLAAGETVTARSRLVLGPGITDEQALALYEAYAGEETSR